MISTDGSITTVAGTGRVTCGQPTCIKNLCAYICSDWTGDGGPAANADIGYPEFITLDRFGDMTIATQVGNSQTVFAPFPSALNNDVSCLRRVDAEGIISTYPRLCNGNLPHPSAPRAHGLAADGAGNIYMADAWNNQIARVSPDGSMTTLVGGYDFMGYSGDGGPADQAKISNPGHMAFDKEGDLYFCDTGNNVVRVLRPRHRGERRRP
jgi:hypothetical protein